MNRRIRNTAANDVERFVLRSGQFSQWLLHALATMTVLAVVGATVLSAVLSPLATVQAQAPSPSPAVTPQGISLSGPVATFLPQLNAAGQSGQPPQGASHVAYSSDSSILAVGTPAGIGLYDALKLQLIHTIDTGGPVVSLAYSPNGQMLASGSYSGTIQVWNAFDGAPVGALLAAQGEVQSLAFSPDSSLLASGSSDGVVRVWRLADGQILKEMHGHTGAVLSVSFSPDGNSVGSGGEDGTAHVWQVSSGVSVDSVVGAVGGVQSVAYSPDGTLLALGSGDGLVRFWHIETGTIVQSQGAHKGAVSDVAFAPDGLTLASDSLDGRTLLWQVSDGRLLRALQGTTGSLDSIALAPNGALLATGALGGAVQIWAASGLPLALSVVPAPSPSATCSDSAAFVTDVTIPDNSVIPPGAGFAKTWRLQNNGTCAWVAEEQLVFVSGDQLGAPNAVPVPATQPGGTADITVPMVAPLNPGGYQSVWQMFDANTGQYFGPRIDAVIQVALPPAPPNFSISASSTNVNAGDSVTIQAGVQNVQAAWVNGVPLVNNGLQETVQLCSTTTFTLDALMPDGTHQFQSVTVNVNGQCQQNEADLDVRDYSVDNFTPQAGQTVHFSARIKNDGGASAGDFDVSWRPCSSCSYVHVAKGLGLDAGDSTTIGWDFTFSKPGTYETKIEVDREGNINEVDGDNKSRTMDIVAGPAQTPTPAPTGTLTPTPTATVPTTSTVTPPPTATTMGNPNLVILSLNASTTHPTPGEVVHFHVAVANQGTGQAQNFRVVWRPGSNAPFILVGDNLNLGPGSQGQVPFDYTFDRTGSYDTEAVVSFNAQARAGAAPGNSKSLTIVVQASAPLSKGTPTPTATGSLAPAIAATPTPTPTDTPSRGAATPTATPAVRPTRTPKSLAPVNTPARTRTPTRTPAPTHTPRTAQTQQNLIVKPPAATHTPRPLVPTRTPTAVVTRTQ